MPLIVGTSGWQYRDWRGVLYPEGLPQRAWLRRFAEEFPAVEVNNAFYRLPELEDVQEGRDRTPPGVSGGAGTGPSEGGDVVGPANWGDGGVAEAAEVRVAPARVPPVGSADAAPPGRARGDAENVVLGRLHREVEHRRLHEGLGLRGVPGGVDAPR